MYAYLPYLFIGNIFLTFIDATVGYHAAPTLVRLGDADQEDTDWAIRRMRKFLAAVVALYMFFNCLFFFNKESLWLLVVTGVIVLDIVAQVILCAKMRNRKGH